MAHSWDPGLVALTVHVSPPRPLRLRSVVLACGGAPLSAAAAGAGAGDLPGGPLARCCRPTGNRLRCQTRDRKAQAPEPASGLSSSEGATATPDTGAPRSLP